MVDQVIQMVDLVDQVVVVIAVLQMVIHSQEILQLVSQEMVGDMMVEIEILMELIDLSVAAVVLPVLVKMLKDLLKVEMVVEVFKYQQHLEILNL